MIVKIKEKLEKTRHVENNDKSKKHILRQRNLRYHHKIVSNKKTS